MDGVLAAVCGDVDVLAGGADVGVAGELGDDFDAAATLGEAGAEGVAQRVSCGQVVGEVEVTGVAGDDVANRGARERCRRAGRAAAVGEARQRGGRCVPRGVAPTRR